MADTEFGNKLNAALRYGGTAAGTVMTIGAVLSILKPEQVVELKAQVEILNNSIFTAYGALMKMWLILGPIALYWLGKMGWDSSTVQSLAGKLLRIAANTADPKAMEAKIAIVNAAASKDIGSEGVVNPELAQHPETASNVVSSPAFIPKA